MRVSRILLAFLFGLLATVAAAEDYPSRPVTIVVMNKLRWKEDSGGI